MKGPTVRTIQLLAGLAAGAQCARFASVDTALDDAWISFRYARNLVEHGVLGYSPAGPPVEGMTNLLWTLLSAVWVAVLPEVDPIGPARLLGGLLHVLTVVGAVGLVARHAPARGREAAALSAVLLGASGNLAYYAVSGLETPLWLALALLSLHLLAEARLLGAGLVLALLGATRPEGVLVGGILVGAVLLARGRGAAPLALPWTAGLGALEAFRLAYYGALVPNTFHAKSPEPFDGLAYLGDYLLWGLGGLGLLALLPALRRREARILGLLALVLALGAAWSGGDWMPGHRRLSLVHLLVVGLVGLAWGSAAAGRERVLVLVGAAALLVGQVGQALRGEDGGRFDHALHAELGRRAAATPGVTAVALVDIGRFGWAFEGEIVDLVGLTDAHLARLEGGHADKPWDEGWFRAKAPELLLARSESPVSDPLTETLRLGRPEVGMVRSVLEHGGYRLHTVLAPSEGKWLLVFAAEGLDLPPELWGPAWPKDLRQLLSEAGGAP